MTVRSSAAVAVVALLMVTATACGSRTDDAGDDNELDKPPISQTTVDRSGNFGTIPSPCGPGDASGTTDIGVTDSTITVTGYSDSGGQVAGLNRGIDQSSAAFVEWCNDQGGINGRKIELVFRNTNYFDYATQVTAACEDSLALVGGLATFDDTGAQLQVDCGLPNVPAAAVSSVQSGADLTYQPLPVPPNQLMVGAAVYAKEHHPDVIDRAGIIHTSVAPVDFVTARVRQALTSIGYTFVYDGASAIGETNWPSFVIDMKERGVQLLLMESSWEEAIGLQAAMQQQDFTALTQLETNFYQDQYPPSAGGNAEGAQVQLTTWPFDEADDNPAMASYLAALAKVAPGSPPEQLGVQSWSAWLLWATAVQSLGSDVTRTGLADALADIHSWDGGGLHGVSDPGASVPAPCFILMEVRGDGFERVFPDREHDARTYEAGNGFACDEDYVVDLATDRDNGAKAPS